MNLWEKFYIQAITIPLPHCRLMFMSSIMCSLYFSWWQFEYFLFFLSEFHFVQIDVYQFCLSFYGTAFSHWRLYAIFFLFSTSQISMISLLCFRFRLLYFFLWFLIRVRIPILTYFYFLYMLFVEGFSLSAVPNLSFSFWKFVSHFYKDLSRDFFDPTIIKQCD